MTDSPGLLDALAKGVQQLQEIQAQTLQEEDKSPESVRTTIPALPLSLSGLELQDWLDLVSTCVADVSNNSCSWWEQVMDEVQQAYAKWLSASPWKGWSDSHNQRCLGNRALDEAECESVHTLAGGRGGHRQARFGSPPGPPKARSSRAEPKRAVVLQRLQGAVLYDTVQKALESVRNWPRWVRRCKAMAMAMAVPDPTVLAKALADTAEPHLKEPDVMFRVQLVKSTLRIDGQPSFENVHSYQQHLQAELESIVAVGGGEAVPS